MVPITLPAKSSYLTSNGAANGVCPLNSTYGYIKGASGWLSASGQTSIECKVMDVKPSYLVLRAKAIVGGVLVGHSYGTTDLSAYTVSGGARFDMPEQEISCDPASAPDPKARVTLEMLNAPQSLLGTIVAVTVSKNNGTTATAFNNIGACLTEMVVTLQPDTACHIRIGSDNTVTATAADMQLQGGEKYTVPLSLTQGFIACLPVSGTTNLDVYRNLLQ